MNLMYGEVVAIRSDNGASIGRVRGTGRAEQRALALRSRGANRRHLAGLRWRRYWPRFGAWKSLSCRPDRLEGTPDQQFSAPKARTTSEELDELSKDPSIIGGINVSGSSR